MSSSKFSDEFKRDAVAQITELTSAAKPPERGGLPQEYFSNLTGDGEGIRPSPLEPDLWTGKVNAYALEPMREKRAEIHRGSRR